MIQSNPWSDELPLQTPHPIPPLNLTVKEERQCIAEIRAKGTSLPNNYVLCNGQRATEFALQYILKHHLKRKEKKHCELPQKDILDRK